MVDVSYSSVVIGDTIASPSSMSSVSSTVSRRPPSPSAVAAIASHGSTSMNDKTANNPANMSGNEKEERDMSNTKRVLTGLVAGAVAGAIAKSVIAPLDRTKIYFQTQKSPYSVRGAINFLKNTAAKEGVFGLWRGNSATMARIVPYSAIQFACHEQWERVLGLDVASSTNHSENKSVRRFLAGSLAGVTSQSLTYPLDLARARMAVTDKGIYDSLRAVFRSMWQQESILAFYRGYLPTLLGVIPYAGLSFFTFDTLKYQYRVSSGNEKPTPLVYLAFGAIAGAIAQTGSYPLEIVRRRMQTAQVTGERYDTLKGSFKKIYTEEGLRGFYKGVTMNWVKGPVAVGLSFACNEFLRDHLRRLQAQ